MRPGPVSVLSRALALVVPLAFGAACSSEPLAEIRSLEGPPAGDVETDDPTDDPSEDPTDDPTDDPVDDPVEDPTDDPEPEPLPPEPVVLGCATGETVESWRSTLQGRPSAVDPGALLNPGDGSVAATCDGDPTTTTNPAETGIITTAQGHLGGQVYFEATVQAFEAGWSQIGVFASPAGVYAMDAYFMEEISAAGTGISGADVVGVAADLDAGQVAFFRNGVREDTQPLLLLPGVGAYHAGGIAMVGNAIAFNFGATPFSFAPPAGYRAWSSGPPGPCGTETVAPLEVPVLVSCGDLSGCTRTGIETDADAEVALVVLGVYDAGSVGSWQWGTDGNGNPIEVETGPGASGGNLVRVERPGKVALVLSAYEPTDWIVEVGSATELVSVSVYGMHVQSVTGADGVPVDVHSICTDGDGGNCSGSTGENFPIAPHAWPFDTGGGDTQGFVQFIEERLCLPLKVFAGAYAARGFLVQ